MAARGKDFITLVSPSDKRPPKSDSAALESIIRDNFTISTWLCFGAVAQGLLFLAIGRLALTPAVALLLYRALEAYAQSIGWKHNETMDGIINKKFSTVFPDELGQFGNQPSNQDVVVFLVGTRFNHPLGMFAPGAQEETAYFTSMIKDLEEHGHDDFGFLGSTSWLNMGDRKTSSEIMEVMYFRTTEGLHKFAHSEIHRKAWDWWNKTVKEHPHLSIWHETYQVPAGNWESIYVNSHVSGINSTAHKFTDEKTGQEAWARPIVDASKGVLKTGAGRMARSKGDDHDKFFSADPYEKQ